MAKKSESEYTRKLFNKGQRVIAFERGDFKPQKAEVFTEDEADKLLKLFASEIIDMDNVTVDSLVSSQAGDVIAAKLKLQEADIAKRLDDARALKAKKAYDEAIAEGFPDNEAREIAGLPASIKKDEA